MHLFGHSLPISLDLLEIVTMNETDTHFASS